MRVLAEVALGARSPADVVPTTELRQRGVVPVLPRLQEAGLLASDADGLCPAYPRPAVYAAQLVRVADACSDAGAGCSLPTSAAVDCWLSLLGSAE